MKELQSPNFGRIAGVLCLDFTNTASWTMGRRTTEHLKVFGDLVRWCLGSAIINREIVVRLSRMEEENPEHAATILSAAWELRETLYKIFDAASQRKAATRQDLQHLNQTLERALLRFEVRHGKKGLFCERRAAGTEFAMLLGPVAWSAADLLTSENCGLIRCCASDTCGWLFLDSTKNHSRRWCDMADCGSRAKAKRYYQRKTKGHLLSGGTGSKPVVGSQKHPTGERA